MAAPASLSYQGRIVKADGQPLQHTSVSFQFEITSPNGSCVIFREQVNGLNMANSNGIFDTPIGASHNFPLTASFTILDAFNNLGSFTCDGGATYVPAVNDGRRLRVQFHDGSSWRMISPDSIIRSVPFAGFSLAAEKLGNHPVADFVMKSSLPSTACSGTQVLSFNGTGFQCVTDQTGSGGGGTITGVAGSGPIVVSGTGNVTISATVGTASGTLAAGNDSRIVNALQSGATAGGDLAGTYPNPTVAKIKGVGIDFSTAPTTGKFLKFDGTNWVPGDMGQSSASTSGYLSATDWNTFNSKQDALTSAITGNFWSGDGTNVYRTTGKVGVGTNSPDVSLTIQSTTPSTAVHPNRAGVIVKAEGTDVGGRYAARTASGTENPTFTGYRSQGTLAAPTAINTSQHLLNVNGMGYDGAAWKEGASILLSPGEAWDTTKTGTNIIFKTATNGTNSSTEKVRISHNGRIGVGVTSPAALVDAESTGTGTMVSGRFASNPGAVGAANLNALVLDNTFGAGNFKSEIKFRGGGTDQFTIGVDPAGSGTQAFYIWDAIANARRLSMDSSGNIGFGVDNPTQKIDVAGKVKATEFCIGASCISSWPSGGGSLAAGSVGTTELADGAVTQNKLETVSGLTAGTYGSATAIPAVTVDAKGRVTAISTNAITGLPTASGASGKFLKSNGTVWSGQDILFSDIKNSVGGSAFNVGSCAANQTVAWSSLTDSFTCQGIGSLDAGAITTGTIDAARLPSSVTTAQWTAASGNVYRSTGSVGIGTASPESSLHISGGDILLDNARFLKMKRNTGGMAIDVLGFASGTDNLKLKMGTSSSTAGLDFVNSSNNVMATLTGAGNFGIGSSSPSHLLNVVGGGNTNKTVLAELRSNFGGAGTGTTLNLVNSTVAGGFAGSAAIESIRQSDTSGDFAIKAADSSATGVEVLRIKGSNGNVGIGTNSPTEKLSVVGGRLGVMANDWNDMYNHVSSSSASPNIYTVRSRGTYSSPTYAQNGDILGTIQMRNHNSNSGAGMISVATENHSASAAGANLILTVVPNGSSSYAESMTLLANGNVGVATPNPQSALHVTGYVQLDVINGVPAATDCDAAAEYGRIKSDPTNNKLYMCGSAGWVEYSVGAGGPTTCPTGYTLIGAAGLPSSYCISTVEKTAATFLNAKTTCYAESTTRGVASLCSNDQWYRACKTGLPTAMSSGNNEWASDEHYNISGTHFALTMGNGSCETMTDQAITGTRTYRCCIK
ncbi:beta strand repeat-containing protein [Bdellovibrio bacteriovorus]|nr:hypothetical protein [Bdellovibrio bacteriovorus]